jgi:hypothetical protein
MTKDERRAGFYEVIRTVVEYTDDTNEAVAMLISCAHSILLTAGQTDQQAIDSLRDLLDGVESAIILRNATAAGRTEILS